MSLSFIILLFIIGFIGSFLSGMLGVGGAIINYPLLLFIPPLLGFMAYSPHEVSGMVAAQVFFATLGGVLSYRKGGYLNKGLIMYMGISILLGSLIGGFFSQYMSGTSVNIIYGILAILAVILMFVPRKSTSDDDQQDLKYNRILASSLSFIVGLSAGIVGAGGAFLLVPIMLTILKLPMRVTIATSLAVTFISSIGSVSGKLISHQIVFLPAVIIIIASLIAAPIGAKVGKKMNEKVLRWSLIIIILATAIKIWGSLLI